MLLHFINLLKISRKPNKYYASEVVNNEYRGVKFFRSNSKDFKVYTEEEKGEDQTNFELLCEESHKCYEVYN